MQITQNQNAIRIWKNLELNIIYAGHAIVGQDWKEPKVCSPFSRIYYIVDGEGILTVNGQRIVLKKGSVWLVPAGMTLGSGSCMSEKNRQGKLRGSRDCIRVKP